MKTAQHWQGIAIGKRLIKFEKKIHGFQDGFTACRHDYHRPAWGTICLLQTEKPSQLIYTWRGLRRTTCYFVNFQLQKFEELLETGWVFQLENPNELEEKIQGFQNSFTTFADMTIADHLKASCAVVCRLLYHDEWMRTCHGFQVKHYTRLNKDTRYNANMSRHQMTCAL
jgi:hypothetical protein